MRRTRARRADRGARDAAPCTAPPLALPRQAHAGLALSMVDEREACETLALLEAMSATFAEQMAPHAT